MHRVVVCGWFILACFIPVVVPNPSAAADKEQKSLKYKSTIHQEGHEIEKSFDLSKKDQVQELTHLLENGEVEELARDTPPQILDITWEVALWSVVIFVLLFLILRKLAWGPMLEGLQKREHNIRQALDDALRARDEAQKIQTELKAEMAQAAQKVHEMIQEARRDGQELKNQLKTEAQAENQKERERLYREIDTARDQALQQIWNQAAQLAAILSSKVIRRKLTPDDHRSLIDEALGEFQTAGSNRR